MQFFGPGFCLNKSKIPPTPFFRRSGSGGAKQVERLLHLGTTIDADAECKRGRLELYPPAPILTGDEGRIIAAIRQPGLQVLCKSLSIHAFVYQFFLFSG